MDLRLLRCATLVLAAALSACASQQSPFESTKAPTNYKSDIVAFLRTYLNNPTNVREAAVAPPSLQKVDGDQRYIACVRFNARRLDGRYAGLLNTAAIFDNSGKLTRFLDLTADPTAADNAVRTQLSDVCRTAAYEPFPELESLTR
jgi:hypothetical protein